MDVLELANHKFELSPEAILNEDKWVSIIINFLEKTENISNINHQHIAILNYSKLYFLHNKTCPQVDVICKEIGINLSQLVSLFPNWPRTVFNLNLIFQKSLGIQPENL